MSIATVFGKGVSYYSTHPTVTCPDCGSPADADFRDHGGDCLTAGSAATPRNALGIIRRWALNHRTFSSNDLRAAFDQAGIPGPSRGPAFTAARRKGWVEQDGHTPSLAGSTKGHDVKTYTSLCYVEARAS